MKKDLLELIVYGVASIMSGMLFFFGIMYPDYLYTKETYEITAECDTQKLWGLTREQVDELSDVQKARLIGELDQSDLIYESRIWNMIKSF